MEKRISTPYYLAGRGAVRYHNNQAEKSGKWAAGAALGAGALAHPKTSEAALNFAAQQGFKIDSSQAKGFSTALGFAAGGAAAYGGIHKMKARKLDKQYRARKVKR